MSDANPTTEILPKWKRGDEITADRLNSLVNYVVQASRGINPPKQRGGRGDAVPSVARFKITAVHLDYLECHTWDGINEGEVPIYVARPVRLRASETSRTFSGGTVTYSQPANPETATGLTRTATIGGTDEAQTVVPEYVVGDEIYAVQNMGGGTGVTISSNGEKIPVLWLDMNIDGRAWAKSA